MDVSSHILLIVADVLELDPAEVKLDSHLVYDLGANSVDIADLIWRIESDPKWEIEEIPHEILLSFETIQDVVKYLEQHHKSTVQPNINIAARVVLASDHGGRSLRAILRAHIEDQQITVRDLGTDEPHEVDFPEYAEVAARAVARGEAEYAVLVGRTGIGMAMAANKVNGVRAAVVHNLLTARLCRQRYDANILCLGASLLGEGLAALCVNEFLATAFQPGSHGERRRHLSRIHDIEKRRTS